MSVVDRQEIEAAYRAEREAEDPKAWEKEYLEDCRNGNTPCDIPF